MTPHDPADCAVCRRAVPPLTPVRTSLLRRVETENSRGWCPNKAELTEGLRPGTRKMHYRLLGELEHAGLIESPRRLLGGSFKYSLTEEGKTALRITDDNEEVFDQDAHA